MKDIENEKIMNLRSSWLSMREHAEKGDEIDYDKFKDVFTDTYNLLEAYGSGDIVHKDLLPIIVLGYDFDRNVSNNCSQRTQAIVDFTESFFSAFAWGAPVFTQPTSLISPNMEFVCVDYIDVDNTIEVFMKLLIS